MTADTLPVVVLEKPINLWGGLDPQDGTITDGAHPQRGQSIAGKVMILPGTHGSSSGASILIDAVRRGFGPAAIVVRRPDPQIAIASLLAGELYGIPLPVKVATAEDYSRLEKQHSINLANLFRQRDENS
ncbi:DUF126 domain-containing protein [Mesorhizobium sp. CA8]|uniref:aconitase X swivel domain-containing protein n=1 Tax=unclassified Mesorhizobium TaxID=325217 RepID=UPI001CCCDF96|nr:MULTISPECIES: DUF126 domain-containing protein [unclassified Mesorhizobium]MBZ9765051.1 DUF126 domain-containing protein [Mesorhizobium sp. CA8]MBZ9823487.1 DUF126 domain-containing protein [Mesorhizobium sp. CA4]